jgi:hypothetical protein
MATRKVFYIKNNKVVNKDFNFNWHKGFSVSQKQKNVFELHSLIKKHFDVNYDEILEISTKSKSSLGKRLSSFNLFLKYNGKKYNMESAYQSSKVFKTVVGEEQNNILIEASPYKSKKFIGKIDHSYLVSFKFFDREFPLKPRTLFYDWLYIYTIDQIPDLYNLISKYKYFTDIEFNPEKSLNCQARSLTLYFWLVKNNKLLDYLSNPIKYYSNL